MATKKWETLSKFRAPSLKFRVEDLIKILLENRGIKTKKEKEDFLSPKLEEVTIGSVGINKLQLSKALKRIQKAIKNQEHIIIFGDYDVDGICGTAILWETLHSLGAKVLPYIPHRIDEGYGLSVKALQNSELRAQNVKLIITVDNGIVANDAVEFANKQKIDVIITDHHVPSKKLPKAHAIVHTTKLCGTGVAYLLSQEISNFQFPISNKYQLPKDHLSLVALATVADLVPLTGQNRTLLKFGLEKLHTSKRIGFLELCSEAALDKTTIGVYEIGHMIAPRLNAMGRLEYAMDSLRLLCTTNKKRAQDLALLLGSTNRERQQLTQETVVHALSSINKSTDQQINKLLFIVHESYQPGVIGLVAGKLVEEFYRPAIVVSKGKTHSKASARSIAGFNIIEFIRNASDFLVDAGGHPMAAGFTVETANLAVLQDTLEKLADQLLTDEHFKRILRIDCELPFELIEQNLYEEIQKLAPFGMKNPEPTFVAKEVQIADIRLVGREGKHLKLRLQSTNQLINQSTNYDGIAFGIGERVKEFKLGDKVDIVYTIDENTWNGKTSLQLKVRDIKK